MAPRTGIVAAELLAATAVAELFVAREIVPGAAMPETPSAPADLVAAVLGLAAVLVAVRSRQARTPLGLTILGISAILTALGPTDLLSFYDGGGLAMALGAASLVALWLLVFGRPVPRCWPGGPRQPTSRRWSDDLVRRLLAYLTIGVLGVPLMSLGGAGVACSGAAPDDDVCAAAGGILGFGLGVLAFLATVVTCELVARTHRRRRSRDPAGAVSR